MFPRHHARRDYEFQRDHLDAKVDIPEFERKMQLDKFLNWLHLVERVFDYEDVPDHHKVKFVVIKLKKYTSLWWENLKK